MMRDPSVGFKVFVLPSTTNVCTLALAPAAVETTDYAYKSDGRDYSILAPGLPLNPSEVNRLIELLQDALRVWNDDNCPLPELVQRVWAQHQGFSPEYVATMIAERVKERVLRDAQKD